MRIAIAVGLALAIAPSGASAATEIAPPGKAGADQYFETVPTSKGGVTPPGGPGSGNAPGGPGAGALPALSRMGPDGQRAASLAHGIQALEGLSARRLAARTPGTGTPSPAGRSTLGSLAHVLGGEDTGGLGPALPVLFAASLVIALILGGWRWRHRERLEV